jgi:hypothetical protein
LRICGALNISFETIASQRWLPISGARHFRIDI